MGQPRYTEFMTLPLDGPIAVHAGKSTDGEPLQAPAQRRPRKMRDGRLQGIKAIVERQQRKAAKGDDHRLVLDRQDRRLRLGWPRRNIGHRGPLLPLGDRFLVDPVALGQCSQALLTMLYRSTDCLCRGGAPVQNLNHNVNNHTAKK